MLDWTSKHESLCALARSRKARLDQIDSARRQALLRQVDERAAEAAAAHAQRLHHAECVAESKPWLCLIALASRLQLLQVGLQTMAGLQTSLKDLLSKGCLT
jgi:hypothetical protein